MFQNYFDDYISKYDEYDYPSNKTKQLFLDLLNSYKLYDNNNNKDTNEYKFNTSLNLVCDI
jgi:hypothetical protein